MQISSDVLLGWEWQWTASKHDRMQACRSWNRFKWNQSAPPFLFFSSYSTSFLFQPLSLPFHSLSAPCRRGRMAARCSLNAELSALYKPERLSYCGNKDASHIGEVGCWPFSVLEYKSILLLSVI